MRIGSFNPNETRLDKGKNTLLDSRDDAPLSDFEEGLRTDFAAEIDQAEKDQDEVSSNFA